MSHITTSKAKILDLDALETAVQKLGGTLVRGKRTYNWYGRSVGDTAIPEGMSKAELGHCDHAIQLPGVHYEVGVISRGDHYITACDYYGYDGNSRHDGHKLVRAFGEGLSKLELEYQMEVVRRTATANGWSYTESVDAETGEPLITLNQY